MIISRYLTKEVLNALLAVSFVLLLIFLSNQLVRYLSYAAMGKVGANILLQLMGFEIPYLLALILPLGLYLGIVLAYGRMYADSELRVMHACGLSRLQLLYMTSGIILVVMAVVLLLTTWVNPLIMSKKDKLIARSLSIDNVLDTLMPGRFQVSNDGKRVLYVERIQRAKKQASNLFLADQGNNPIDESTPWTVVAAAEGSQMTIRATNERFIVANDGYRYEGTPGENDFEIIQFKKYAVRIPKMALDSKRLMQESMPTHQLWEKYDSPAEAAELQWRISIALSVGFLGWLAVLLSHVSPRHGRYSPLFIAILIYVIYINLLFVARTWIEQKFLPVGVGMWWVHLLMLGVIGIVAGFKGDLRLKSWWRRIT